MTLQSSGPISLTDINNEIGYGSSAQISPSDSVPRRLANKPSGTISLSDFYGQTGKVDGTFTVTSGTQSGTGYPTRTISFGSPGLPLLGGYVTSISSVFDLVDTYSYNMVFSVQSYDRGDLYLTDSLSTRGKAWFQASTVPGNVGYVWSASYKSSGTSWLWGGSPATIAIRMIPIF